MGGWPPCCAGGQHYDHSTGAGGLEALTRDRGEAEGQTVQWDSAIWAPLIGSQNGSSTRARRSTVQRGLSWRC
eukprot:5867892-Ditylum_brightwellii.AAC.1